MIDRRTLIAGAAAMTAMARMAAAQEAATPYVVPEDQMPRYVRLQGEVPAGEIHVLPDQFALLWTLPDNRAIRYAVGIGRAGLYEAGSFFIGAKKEWPAWTPTPEMVERDPASYGRWVDGMPGGPNNPLGARALYLFTPERGDTFLRIHGTNAPRTIGSRVSNGCARLLNSHMIHLYDQVPLQARVVLHPVRGTATTGG